MNETIDKIKTWVMANKPLAFGGAAVILFLLFGKKLLRRSRPRRRRALRSVYRPAVRRRTVRRSRPASRRRGSGVKKPWQVKGSEAARRHMARLRRMR
jgi:hypothetical protein